MDRIHAGLLERLNGGARNLALSEHQSLIEQIKDKKYKRVQGIGDDFIPDTNLYNALGAIYPLLNRDKKNEALNAYLSQFDKLSNISVSLNHTPYIRDPQLLSDIALARTIYWPGLHDQETLWEGKKDFSKLQKEIMTDDGLFNKDKVASDFLVAYALMRKDFSDFGEEYIKAANPEFVERVLKGITALKFARKTSDGEVAEGRKRLYELLPASVIEKIDSLREEADWVEIGLFNNH